MPIFKVNIKWQKEKFLNIECDTDDSPEVFKALIYSLTGVEPNNQKIMMPGGSLKSSWTGIRLKDGITIMVMGTPEELRKTQVDIEKTNFVEDMTEGQINRALKLPQGLTNIGNTCYMNATIQCLRGIPELSKAMQNYIKSSDVNQQNTFVSLLGNLFKAMDTAEKAINPFLVLKSLHDICPQFTSTQQVPAEHGGGSVLMQQDANECWTEIMRCLSKILEMPPVFRDVSCIPESFIGSEQKWNFVEKFLTGNLEVVTVNTENEEEKLVTEEPFLQLSCFIDKEVKYLQTGIRNGLEGSLTKFSDTLAKDTIFKRSSKISRLPSYLSMQFVRFYYKEKEKINAKVLKDVKYPLELDMYEFCTPQLQNKLLPMREKNKISEDKKANAEKERKINGSTLIKNTEVRKHHQSWFKEDRGSNNSGLYELKAVLTHQGRSSNSGHYLGWVRFKDDVWMKYDDDMVSEATSEDILRLSGGGDWHCAYLLMYGSKLIEQEEDGSQDNNGDVVNQPMDCESSIKK